MYRYTNDEEKKLVGQTNGQQTTNNQSGIRDDEGTVENGVLTVAPAFSGSQVRDIAKRYKGATKDAGEYYMHNGVQYLYSDLEPAPLKPSHDAPMREPKGYYQKVDGGVVSNGLFIADDSLSREEAKQAALNYGDSVGRDDAYYYQYGGKVRKAKKTLFAKPDSEKPEIIDTTGYAEQHRVENGYVVDGLFVADDNLSADAARNVALRYYLGTNPKGKAFYYQHNGKIYVADTTNRAEAKYTPDGEKPAPVKVGAARPAPQPAQTKPVQQEVKPAQKTVVTEAKPAPQPTNTTVPANPQEHPTQPATVKTESVEKPVEKSEAQTSAANVNAVKQVDGGYDVNGFFVGNDNLSEDTVRNMAYRFYRSSTGKDGAFYYQYKGKIYVVDKSLRADTTSIPEGKKPEPVNITVPTASAQAKQEVPQQTVQVTQNQTAQAATPQPKKPASATSANGRFNAQEAANFKEASQNLTPLKSKEEQELEGINAYLKDDKRDFSHAGGYAVNGYFVADDSLSYGEATRAAKEYYAAIHNDYNGKPGRKSPGPYHDIFQWRGEQYGTKEGEGSKPRWSVKPKKVKASDYEEYDKQIARKKELERSLTEKPSIAQSPSPISEPTASQSATVTNTPAQQTNVQPEIQNNGAQTGTQHTQPQQTGSTVQGSNPEEVISTEVKDDTSGSEVSVKKGTGDNVTTTTSTGKTEDTTKEEEQKRFSDLFSESRKNLKQKKTDAAKMQKYYALADALKVIGDMGGTAIGGAIGGDALGGATPTEGTKPSRGYIEAFEKAKAADEALAKLDQEEYKLEIAYDKKKEEREYKEKQNALLQQYKIDLEKLRQEGRAASEERRAELKEEEMRLRAQLNEALAKLKSDLKFNNDLSLLDERTNDQIELIDYRTGAQKDVIDYRNDNGLYDSRRSRETKPVRFRDGTNMQIPLTYYESMKQDLIGDDWNGKRVTKDNVEQYIRNNPNVVKDYLRGFGIEVGTSTTPLTTSTPAPRETTAPSPSNGSATNRRKSTDEILDAL